MADLLRQVRHCCVVATVASRAGVDRQTHKCQGRKVFRSGDWRIVDGRAPCGSYWDNAGTDRVRDGTPLTFPGDVLDIVCGRAIRGSFSALGVDLDLAQGLAHAGPQLDLEIRDATEQPVR